MLRDPADEFAMAVNAVLERAMVEGAEGRDTEVLALSTILTVTTLPPAIQA